jgi:hypothetical protein
MQRERRYHKEFNLILDLGWCFRLQHRTPCLNNIDCQGTTQTWSTFDTLSLFRTLCCQLRAPPNILCGKHRLELRPPTPNSFQAICTICVVHTDLQVCPTLQLPRLFNVFLGFPTFALLSFLVHRSWYTKQNKLTNKKNLNKFYLPLISPGFAIALGTCNKPFKPLGYPSGRVKSREGLQRTYPQSSPRCLSKSAFV